jgi:tRNA pseudouridine13 synthase
MDKIRRRSRLMDAPLLTADLPGIGGRIKASVDDFEVVEIPAYAPCGQGEHLYLWVEKRSLGAEYFIRQLAQRLNLAPGDVGTAGLKDRHAVTRQMVSVPYSAEANLPRLEGDGIRLLSVSRHTNKLRPGHLLGNRFRILIRDVEHADRLGPILERICTNGLPNFYGEQRFGRGGQTGLWGMALLRKDDPPPDEHGRKPNLHKRFLKKMVLSAAQSLLFNRYLARRLQDGLLRRVLPGDVMSHYPRGGLFVAEDVPATQARFDARQVVTTGPMFGRKTFPARGEAAEREAVILALAGLTPQAFLGFGNLLEGTRRHNLVYVEDLAGTAEGGGVRLEFTLPAGSYATILLREVMKTAAIPGDDETASE